MGETGAWGDWNEAQTVVGRQGRGSQSLAVTVCWLLFRAGVDWRRAGAGVQERGSGGDGCWARMVAT